MNVDNLLVIREHFARGVAHRSPGDPSEHAQLDASGEENLIRYNPRDSNFNYCQALVQVQAHLRGDSIYGTKVSFYVYRRSHNRGHEDTDSHRDVRAAIICCHPGLGTLLLIIIRAVTMVITIT